MPEKTTVMIHHCQPSLQSACSSPIPLLLIPLPFIQAQPSSCGCKSSCHVLASNRLQPSHPTCVLVGSFLPIFGNETLSPPACPLNIPLAHRLPSSFLAIFLNARCRINCISTPLANPLPFATHPQTSTLFSSLDLGKFTVISSARQPCPLNSSPARLRLVPQWSG